MSRVFLAEEPSLGRRVVVKVLTPELTSEAGVARFKQEAALTAQLQHPNIVPVLAFGACDGLLYYVTPFIAGESLRKRLERDGALPVEEALRLVREVADALVAAHERGVVHRDIKPENIFLSNGHAVLADFGIARSLAAGGGPPGERLTAVGTSLGTPGYMAPEQAAGEVNVDARADICSLAVVGYEMLAGKPPFTGPSAHADCLCRPHAHPTPLDKWDHIRYHSATWLRYQIRNHILTRPTMAETCSELLDRARRNPKGMRFAEVCRLAECYGFRRARQRGSHVLYTRPGWSRPLNFQNDKGLAKAYQVRQLIAAIDELEARGEG